MQRRITERRVPFFPGWPKHSSTSHIMSILEFKVQTIMMFVSLCQIEIAMFYSDLIAREIFALISLLLSGSSCTYIAGNCFKNSNLRIKVFQYYFPGAR